MLNKPNKISNVNACFNSFLSIIYKSLLRLKSEKYVREFGPSTLIWICNYQLKLNPPEKEHST